ncbi:uncharacterized protein EAE97_002866 [Botrytis byssoidea]|uniref:BTB domain-containing protein n=1 Tax=Botrytis byssoidea TaxID=139641 RepID=A0A9P5IPB3_9HELO|nr:uncharacterized protein EAE97_002866 [Botrytis byssoidea]KAF7949357.1 hypothetical protein EAE97_002866 [Botrytis byssoidea]
MTPEALNETVILYVGPKRKKYIVHKKILCDQSDFFNAGFNKAFEEAANGEMYLPEDNPATFADLIEYLYRGALPYTEKSGTSFLLKLYYLAEKICMTLLMDQLIDKIMEVHMMKHPRGFSAAAVQSIHNHTHGTSKLRLYASALLAFKIHVETEEALEKYLPLNKSCPELFVEIFQIISMHRESVVNFTSASKGVRDAFGPCDFHFHSPDGICYRNAKRSKTMGNKENELSRSSALKRVDTFDSCP